MFKLEIKTGGAAFDDMYDSEDETMNAYAKANEVARILRRVADRVEAMAIEGSCMDINGNKVGEWNLE